MSQFSFGGTGYESPFGNSIFSSPELSKEANLIEILNEGEIPYSYRVIEFDSGTEVFDAYKSQKTEDVPSRKIYIYVEREDKDKSNFFGTACRIRVGKEFNEILMRLQKGEEGFQNIKSLSGLSDHIAKDYSFKSRVLTFALMLELHREAFAQVEGFMQSILSLDEKVASWINSGSKYLDDNWKLKSINYDFAVHGADLEPIIPISIGKGGSSIKIAEKGISNLNYLVNNLHTVAIDVGDSFVGATGVQVDDAIWKFLRHHVSELLEGAIPPQIKSILNKLATILDIAVKAFNGIEKTIKGELAMVNAFICGIINGVISLIQLVLLLVSLIVNNMPLMDIRTFSQIAENQKILEFIEDLVDVIYEGVSGMELNLGKLITDFVKNYVKMISFGVELVGKGLVKLTEFSRYFWAYFSGAVVFEVILEIALAYLTGGASAVAKLSAKVTATITRVTQQFADKGIRLTKGAIEAVSGPLSQLLKFLKKEFSELIEAMKSGRFAEYIRIKLFELFDIVVGSKMFRIGKAIFEEVEMRLVVGYREFTALYKLLKRLGYVFYKRINDPGDEGIAWALAPVGGLGGNQGNFLESLLYEGNEALLKFANELDIIRKSKGGKDEIRENLDIRIRRKTIKDFQEFSKKWEGKSLRSINTETIVRNLYGYTPQANRIANIIEARTMKIKILSDTKFEKRLSKDFTKEDIANTTAITIGKRTFFRESTSIEKFMGELVHEGTHVLDEIKVEELMAKGKSDTEIEAIMGNNHSFEKRAFFHERAYQEAAGIEKDFDTIEEMLENIENEYDKY